MVDGLFEAFVVEVSHAEVRVCDDEFELTAAMCEDKDFGECELVHADV